MKSVDGTKNEEERKTGQRALIFSVAVNARHSRKDAEEYFFDCGNYRHILHFTLLSRFNDLGVTP
jgi:hypothetical protein